MTVEQLSAYVVGIAAGIAARAAPPLEHGTLPATDHDLSTGEVLGLPCYDNAVMRTFTEQVAGWLERLGA